MMKKVAEMNKWLRIAGICGIVTLVLTIPLVVMELVIDSKFGGVSALPIPSLIIYLLFSVLVTALGVVWLWGFVIIARKLKNRLLEVMSYLLIALSALILITDFIVSLAVPAESIFNIVYAAAILFVIGVASIPYGIGILRLNKEFGGIATAAGVLNIIAGISMATVILFFVGLLVVIPAAILEIMVLFKASRELVGDRIKT